MIYKYCYLVRWLQLQIIGSYLLEDKNKTIHKIFKNRKGDDLQVLLFGEEWTQGEYRFSSLMKQKKKGENCAVFCFAGKRFFFYIYDVIVKQLFYKRSTNHYSPINRSEIITDPLRYDPPSNPSRHQLY